MRLIDADKLDTRERGNNSQRTMWHEIERLINSAPTVDAIVPPVKVGQTVWCLIDKFNGVVDGKIYEYTIRSDGLAYFRFTRNGYFTGTAMEDAIGKTVFFTREDAEATLKARENK
jgi:hypothetical protein